MTLDELHQKNEGMVGFKLNSAILCPACFAKSPSRMLVESVVDVLTRDVIDSANRWRYRHVKSTIGCAACGVTL